MLIDWFTVVAQVVNFLILVGLLRHFLYGRIIAAIDHREAEIAARRAETEKRREEAEEAIAASRRKQEELDRRREEFLSKAREEAGHRREELIDRAREEVDRLQGRWRESIRQGQEEFLKDLRRQVNRATCSIARRALADLADVTLERRIVAVFLDRLRSLNEARRGDLAASAREAHGPSRIRTAFNVPEDLHATIAGAMRDVLGGDVRIEFATDDRLICGIELDVNGRRIAFDFEDYLGGLEEQLTAALDRERAGTDGDGPRQDGDGDASSSDSRSRSEAAGQKG